MTRSSCSFANSTMRRKNSRSTTSVVGLWGKEMIRTFGLGQMVFIARRVRSRKSPSPLVSEIERTSAFAMTTE